MAVHANTSSSANDQRSWPSPTPAASQGVAELAHHFRPSALGQEPVGKAWMPAESRTVE